MNVDDVVAAKVEAARVRIQAAKRRSEELAAARKRGLAARHANKLRRIAARQATQPVTTDDGSTPPKENT
ncbi:MULTISPECIES: hypothetical protein [Streptomyces]|uniref:hypothetical protein n=1 Tax=Streptomyces TaxID=1883 RepID=UPI0004BD96E4|nr:MULTISPECIES: hypothetical protein [Streptomyces]KOG81258.1 hypothetical protein ADK33_15775 [Streptomyces griseus subsp. rhodochrous]